MPSPFSEVPVEAQESAENVSNDGQGRMIIEIVERDRLQIAGALHNSACQTLSGLQLFAATLLKRLPGESADLSENVHELEKLLWQASTELRAVLHWLRPPPLREEGLIVSLVELAADISSAVPCEFHCEDRRMEMEPDVARQLYQIAYASAGALAQRRAASRIDILLKGDPENGVILSIFNEDHPASTEASDGAPELCNWELLRLRARAIGGTLTVDSSESGGLRVTCMVKAR
jgi:NarL family two-component system sensor histidine kinase LiaS